MVFYTSSLNTTANNADELTAVDIEILINNFDHSNTPLYEFIRQDTNHIKPYFDVDVKREDVEDFDSIDKKKVLKRAVKFINNTFETEYADLAISESVKKDKISYHIIVTNKTVLKSELAKFKDLNRKTFKKLFIDDGVYGKSQKFRIVGTSKEGENSPLIPLTFEDDLTMHLITNIDDAQTNFSFNFPEPEIKENVKEEKETVKPKYPVEFPKLSACVLGLNVSRSDDYKQWMDVIFAVTNIGRDNGYLKKANTLIHSFSARSNKYDQEHVDKVISSIGVHSNGLGFGSLLSWLKTDNIELFVSLSEKSYGEIKAEFEACHFKVMYPICYCKEQSDGLLVMKRKALMEAYENLSFIETNKKGDKKVVQFTSEWVKDKTIPTFDKIDFIPNDRNPLIYNLFKGFKADKLTNVEEVDISVILQHIRILVNHDEASFEYVVKWLAHIIQKPHEIAGVALVFKSMQGAGKNIFIDWLGNDLLSSDYYYTTADADTLFGRFATGLKNKLLVNLDETSGKDTFMNSEKIKNLLTAETIKYEQKGIDAFTIRNYARWIFSTNNNTPVKVEQGDRRFAIFESSNEKCQTGTTDIDYFKRLKASMNDDNVKYTFFKYLRDLDISQFDLIRNRPVTEFYKEVQETTIPIIARFLNDEICVDTEVKYKARDIYMQYKAYCTDYGYSPSTETAFGRDILRYEGVEKRRSNGIVYIFNIDAVKESLRKVGLMVDNDIDFIESDSGN